MSVVVLGSGPIDASLNECSEFAVVPSHGRGDKLWFVVNLEDESPAGEHVTKPRARTPFELGGRGTQRRSNPCLILVHLRPPGSAEAKALVGIFIESCVVAVSHSRGPRVANDAPVQRALRNGTRY